MFNWPHAFAGDPMMIAWEFQQTMFRAREIAGPMRWRDLSMAEKNPYFEKARIEVAREMLGMRV